MHAGHLLRLCMHACMHLDGNYTLILKSYVLQIFVAVDKTDGCSTVHDE